MSASSSSPEPPDRPSMGTIFKYRDRLRDLSLLPCELETYPWRPAESWPEFFEKRLRPMVYYLHASVTHDFVLIGAKASYFPAEREEILHWLEQILLHCRLLLMSRSAPCVRFQDDWAVPFPASWEVPGESTAMFGILYRLSMSLDFLDIDRLDFPMNKFSLIPLYVEARKTRSRYNTPDEYYPYDKFGMLEDPESFLHPYGGNVAEPLSRLGSYMREPVSSDEES
ncbi:hypothetical protein B0H11DRAFT_2230122 [Mycena galericulata]|nr:hypothetical protein B0H11DRAFT_2259022 [Mycena galericulata]KAJ7448448.1 hypothetical protein B0H11DRAFT_2247735 [Mycena galericulata]KAJ7488587.1 hypothetical protein B0H11DRAFT_2230122 [Mycena galericulata]